MKLRFLLGLGAGYVLGARAGRQAYDALVDRAQTLLGNERVERLRGEVASAVDLGGDTQDQDATTSSTPAAKPKAKAQTSGADTDVVLPDLTTTKASNSTPSSGTKNPAKPVTPPSTDL